MQTRGRFLKSVAGLAVFGWLGGRVTPTTPVETGIIRDSVLRPVADYQLYASGGLCAPLTPFYDLPAIPLPRLTASRGDISFDRTDG